MDLPEPRQLGARFLAGALVVSAFLVQGLLTSSPSRVTAAERPPEESLLTSHRVKVTSAGLHDFLTSFQKGPIERPDIIQRLIEQLGSDEFAQREEASGKLLARAVSPVKELKAALDNPDPEIRFRARKILDQVGRRVPTSALLFAALLVIRDRELDGLAGDVLRIIPLCDSEPLRAAAGQAMRATVRRGDRPLLARALASDNASARAIATAGLAVINARAEPPLTIDPVTWVDFLNTYVVCGRCGGERTEFLKDIPASLARHFEQVTRTANTIDAVVNRHGTSPWLYPVRGKNETPRCLVEAGKKHYPIQGSWRQHWTQWIVLDENGKHIQGGPAQGPHTESRVDFLVVPLGNSRTRRQPR
jgi:hypothetical protein